MSIYLEKCPNYKPLPMLNDDGTEQHICCDGARFHVLSWSGVIGRDGKMHGFKHCSEPNCEINKRTKIQMKKFGCKI